MGMLKNLFARLSSGPVDWDELEEVLIRSDFGIPMTTHLLEAMRARGLDLNGDSARRVLREEILRVMAPPTPPPDPSESSKPLTILVTGVNGTGKTTSCAKLAHWLQRQGHSCLLAAGDTFRAAAIEQLVRWGEKLGIEVVKSQYQADAAALCHDAWQSASRRAADFLVCDTAGRLHTKGNLMRELEKIARTLAKLDPAAPQEKWIVVDATTGSNAIVQAREFHQAIGLTGLVLTKMDGSGKGGAAVAIKHELGIPTRFIGTGENPDDFAPFDPDWFVDRIA
jgi:fused signal recognition particle receptor